MTRGEIEWFASEARRGAKLDLKSIEIYPADLAELCRLALIGEPIDRREREIAAALDEIAAEGQACDAVLACNETPRGDTQAG